MPVLWGGKPVPSPWTWADLLHISRMQQKRPSDSPWWLRKGQTLPAGALEASLAACPQSHAVRSPRHVESQVSVSQAEGSTAHLSPAAPCVREHVSTQMILAAKTQVTRRLQSPISIPRPLQAQGTGLTFQPDRIPDPSSGSVAPNVSCHSVSGRSVTPHSNRTTCVHILPVQVGKNDVCHADCVTLTWCLNACDSFGPFFPGCLSLTIPLPPKAAWCEIYIFFWASDIFNFIVSLSHCFPHSKASISVASRPANTSPSTLSDH